MLRKRLVTQQSVTNGFERKVARLGNSEAGTKVLVYM